MALARIRSRSGHLFRKVRRRKRIMSPRGTCEGAPKKFHVLRLSYAVKRRNDVANFFRCVSDSNPYGVIMRRAAVPRIRISAGVKRKRQKGERERSGEEELPSLLPSRSFLLFASDAPPRADEDFRRTPFGGCANRLLIPRLRGCRRG